MANEIKFYLSGGASNTNPFLSNGGTISNTEIVSGLLNNLWPDVSESDAFNGVTDHKVIFIKNVSGGALTAVRAYFGELDNFIGMAVLSSTTPNTAVEVLASPISVVTDYFKIWDNSGEAPTAQISCNNTVKRVVLLVNYATHPVYNQYPDKIELMLAKTGSPTGTATVKVWAMASGVAPTATDNTVIRTLGTLDVSTLTTSFTKKVFSTVADLVTNPLPGVGWRIGIEYTTGTAANTLVVGVSAQPATPLQFSGIAQSWDGSKWIDFANNLPSMAVYTNTGACFQSGNPPPPGGGTPPPGDCGSSAPAQGTIPVAGGGGGMTANGYAITAATDNGNDGNVAANAIDHNLATRWSQNSTNALLTLDMGAVHPVDRVKIAWYKGDERQAKFNLRFSTDNITYTNIAAQNGANWTSSGHSTQLEEYSFTNFAGMTVTSVAGVTQATIQSWISYMLILTSDSGNGTTPAAQASLIANELIEALSDPLIGKSYDPNADVQDGWNAPDGQGDQEICDVCEAYPNAEETQFSDGLKVPYYWDIQTMKCVAPGAANTPQTISPKVTMQNFGSAMPPSPKLWLIFWGTTWNGGTGTTYRQGLVDYVQNKLLGTDKGWFNQGMTDYGFGMPTWGGYAIYNGTIPSDIHNIGPDNIEETVVEAVINLGVVSDPSSSTYVSNNVRGSNIMYCVVPDLTWSYGSNAGFEAFHESFVHTSNTANPPPPPPPPPTDPPGGTPDPPPTPPPPTQLPGSVNARYIRLVGLGNTVNTWNSVTEMELWGNDVGNPNPSPPPPGGGNFSKPSSYDTGLILPNLNNNDFVAIHLERLIPPRSNHVELENYSIVISNEPHPAPPSDEPIPGLPGGGGGGPGGDPNLPPIGEIPLPSPPGVFDPGTIPPPEPVPPPPPDTNPPPPDGNPGGGPCPGPPEPPGGGGGGGGTTPDGIQLVTLPAGYVYQEQHTNFKENFQSNGSFRLDCGVQPQLNELNLTFYLNLSSGSDEISSKLSGGTHTDSKAKNGRCYDIGVNQDGKRVRIRKEDPHPDYHDGPSHSISLGSLNGKWVGFQSLKWNEGSNCHLQCWVDTSGSTSPTNKWTKILDDVDTGGWFESPYLTCFAANDSQTTIRVDGMSTSKFHYKFLCATRIHKT